MKAELVPAMEQLCHMGFGECGQRGRAGRAAEGVPHISVPLPVPFILHPAAGGIVGTGLPGWGKGEEMGDVAWEGLMQKDFYPVA